MIARDLPTCHNPDLVFVSQVPNLPLAGIAVVHPQPAYGDRQHHNRVNQVIDQYLDLKEVAQIALDTRYCNNPTMIRNAVQFENLISRLDVVITTTRLHGMIFALKRGIPVVAIDPIAGGAKVTAQAKALGWPLIFNGDNVEKEMIREAVNLCLNGSMDEIVANVKANALAKLDFVRTEFLQILSDAKPPNAPE